MKLEPYTNIAGISLDIGEPDLINISGNLSRIQVNSIGLTEMDYGSRIYRFDQSGVLNELTIECIAIEHQGLTIPFAHLKSYIATKDNDAFDKFGFCVSPLLGLAFDPEQSPWLTVLTKQGISAWSKI